MIAVFNHVNKIFNFESENECQQWVTYFQQASQSKVKLLFTIINQKLGNENELY